MQILGHRGIPAKLPENTINGFKHVLSLPVDGIELDLHLTKDHEFVINHDPYINYLDEKFIIHQHTLAELQYFTSSHRIEHLAPTLNVLFDQLQTELKNKEVWLELKSDEAEYHFLFAHPEKVVQKLQSLNFLKGYHIYYKSFDHQLLNLMADNGFSTDSLVPLIEDDAHLSSFLSSLKFKPSRISKHFEKITANEVAYCREQGFKLFGWTPNTLQELQQCKKLQLDGIITDDAVFALHFLRK
jgi:glycerophosphoryl diester phosphodiesterase